MRFSFVVLSGLLALGAPAHAQTMTEEEVKRLALEAILENPQIVMDAVAILREREAAAASDARASALQDNLALLRNDENAPVMGNPDGDVVIVEFFDYNCAYCKRAGNVLQNLLAKDDQIKVVYRELPIYGREPSEAAARVSLAANMQGRYVDFHFGLLTGAASRGRIDGDTALKVAADLGLDMDQLKRDMQSDAVNEHIATSFALAEALQFQGTPAFLVGDEVIPGFVDEATMAQIIADQRGG